MDNERIKRWFEDGQVREAFLGEGKFRIPDVTYRDTHDRILVMTQLFKWAQQSNSKEVTKKFTNTIRDFLLYHFAEAIDVILCYFIVKQDGYTLVDVDFQGLKNDIVSAINSNGTAISSDEVLRSQIIGISKYLPWVIQ